MAVVLLIVGILLFIGLVVIHEWGHFIAARHSGVEAEEFGIFFPPRLYKRRMKGGWLFTINLLPLGGFVRLKGEHDSDIEPGSFGAASLWNKTKIMAAGVVMNLVAALVLFTILALIGMPQLIPHQYTVKSDTRVTSRQVLITYILPNSPAAKAGLKTEDEITALQVPGRQRITVTSSDGLHNITKSLAGKKINIFYTRGGQNYETRATLLTNAAVAASQKTNNPKANLGIAPQQFSVQRSTWSAPVVAVGLSAQITALTFQGLGHALGGLGSLIAGFVTGNNTARQHGQTAASSQVAGPVGIFVILKDGSLLGWQFMLFIIALISLTLAIMNILPIPALDGGRLWITLIARALKRPLSANAEEIINAAGFMILLVLIVLITIADVHRFL